MPKTLEKTILSCGVQVKIGLNNVFSEDRYSTLHSLSVLFTDICFIRRCTIAEFATPTVW